jgi:hypothetical protein
VQSANAAALAPELGQLQPFVAAFQQAARASLRRLGRPNTFLAHARAARVAEEGAAAALEARARAGQVACRGTWARVTIDQFRHLALQTG